mgnify:CR=1 FL=1
MPVIPDDDTSMLLTSADPLALCRVKLPPIPLGEENPLMLVIFEDSIAVWCQDRPDTLEWLTPGESLLELLNRQ